jgi:3-hydroxyacyl-CoA dehydrogenase
MGRLGQKTGTGWHRYESGSRTPIPDPVIEQLIVEHSHHAGIARRDISAQEILDRCLYAMSNEGAKILEEGMASPPVDIDMAWLHGDGFPAWRRGPMFYADQVVLPTVCEAILRYRDRFGDDFWSTAPLMEELARSGNGFFPSSVTAPTIVC